MKRLIPTWLAIAACSASGSLLLLPVGLALGVYGCVVAHRGANGKYGP